MMALTRRTSWVIWTLVLMVMCTPITNGLEETNPLFWRSEAHDELRAALRSTEHNTNRAEAVIFFIGDGLGVSTITAARIMKGQRAGAPGEEAKLSFEDFPHFGYSKTYNTNSQVPDSAGTATAYLTGVKAKRRTIGLDAGIKNVSVCYPTTMNHSVDSILKLAKEAGMAVGFVTTTRVTHASPAATYAHVPERFWEAALPEEARQAGCKDIAAQLVESDFDIDVIMGGGRGWLTPYNLSDPVEPDKFGARPDGRNLIEEWQARYSQKGIAKYVWNQTEFDRIDPWNTDYLLGLFGYEHLHYSDDRAQGVGEQPSLAEMMEKAIRLLRRKNNRFFLFIEAGRIDHAHHLSLASHALSDTIALEQAVSKAVALTNDNTLITVTADHGHTLSFAGYQPRGHKILDKIFSDERGLPYTTLGYYNGPYNSIVQKSLVETDERPNITNVNTADSNYQQQALMFHLYETHGGEDVAIFSRGPWSHLFHSVHEQNYIMHVMQYAACIGDYLDRCHTADPTEGSPVTTPGSGSAFPRSMAWLPLVLYAATRALE
ncbi:alkaline phosphatase-like [Patiria miniata]|uniref:Alkaline phosphatase n=1 Tax=Patiria miniata TaxID=46514 RepID=A0A914AUD5_PATMI|nr:alkaline phosphatase-like [Patiria miniata]